MRAARSAKPNIPIRTEPKINKGPDVDANVMSLSPSSLDKTFKALSLEVNLAPMGYPETKLIMKGKLPSPDIRNIGFIIGSSNFPK